jgi:hypothetical protein
MGMVDVGCQVVCQGRRRLIMVPRSPIGLRTHVTGLTAIIQQEEEARARLEQAAQDLDDHGLDSTALRRGMNESRPVMGSLRLMRLQVIAERWRNGGRGSPSTTQGSPVTS